MPKWTRIVAPINRMIEPKILFEGEYSKVLEPDCHFIVLKKDFFFSYFFISIISLMSLFAIFNELQFKSSEASTNGVAIENIEERHMTEPETKKKEEIVKSMKKGLSGFKDRYGDRAKEVMYATATARAKGE